jgi:hypothetical protein
MIFNNSPFEKGEHQYICDDIFKVRALFMKSNKYIPIPRGPSAAGRQIRRPLYFLLFFLLVPTQKICTEAYGNNMITIPKLGASFYDMPWLPHKKPWGLSHQWTIGVAFGQALSYEWWWMAETSLGFGYLANLNAPFISSFAGGAGVRYNFLFDDIRPFFNLSLHYVQFLGQAVKDIPLNLGWPIFVGFKPLLGLEWLFFSEMSIALEIAYGLYFNINEPFRRILHTGISYSLYF